MTQLFVDTTFKRLDITAEDCKAPIIWELIVFETEEDAQKTASWLNLGTSIQQVTNGFLISYMGYFLSTSCSMFYKMQEYFTVKYTLI